MDDTKVNPSTEKEHLSMQQSDREGGIVEGADSIQDQIIIAPEIMSQILEQLDFQTLKRVRLVCKSWLREAGTHMEKRGSVRFGFEKLQEFVETFQNEMPDLPQPFHSIRFNSNGTEDCELLLSQLASLCPPLVITRLDARGTPLHLTIALIIESSASLEYIYLATRTLEIGSIPARETVFPKLLALHVAPDEDFPTFSHEYFPSVVARVVECSPNLETYKSWGDGEQSSETLLRVNFGNVKTLKLHHGNLRDKVLNHILSIPFSRLENLKMCLPINESFFMEANALLPLYVTVAKCTQTLRILDVSYVRGPDLLTDFPVCPHLQELSLRSFPESSDWLFVSFPALRVLTVCGVAVNRRRNSWNDQSPFMGLKTLRVHEISSGRRQFVSRDREDRIEEPLRFFEKFPALDCLGMNSSFVLRCCILKATGDSRFSSLLEGVKTLELIGNDDGSADLNLAPLAVLKGVERISIISKWNRDILSLPYKDMPALRVIQFPWSWHQKVPCPKGQLLEMARGVEKVVVTSYRRDRGSCETPIDLQSFLDSALNAELGLTEWQKMRV